MKMIINNEFCEFLLQQVYLGSSDDFSKESIYNSIAHDIYTTPKDSISKQILSFFEEHGITGSHRSADIYFLIEVNLSLLAEFGIIEIQDKEISNIKITNKGLLYLFKVNESTKEGASKVRLLDLLH